MLHVCLELLYKVIRSWVLALGENYKKSGSEKKQLLCARSKLGKMSLVTFSVVTLLFTLLSGFCSLPSKILKSLPLGHNYLCSNGIPHSGNPFPIVLGRKGAGHLQR